MLIFGALVGHPPIALLDFGRQICPSQSYTFIRCLIMFTLFCNVTICTPGIFLLNPLEEAGVRVVLQVSVVPAFREIQSFVATFVSFSAFLVASISETHRGVVGGRVHYNVARLRRVIAHV